MGNKSFVKRQSSIMETSSNGVTVTTPSIYNALYFVRLGVDNPKFAETIRSGNNAVNPLTVTKTEVKLTPGFISLKAWLDKYSTSWTTYSVKNPQVPMSPTARTFSAGLETSARNQASTSILKKIRKSQVQISGPTFIGELNEAIKMIKHPASAIQDLLKQHVKNVEKRTLVRYKHGFKRDISAHKVQQVIADTWLETQFGLLPLMSDVKDASIALARLYHEPRLTRVSSVTIVEGLVSHKVTSSQYGSFLSALTNTLLKDRATVTYHVGLEAKTDASDAPYNRMLELSGFTLNEFLPTAWELLPWSFFMDYFSNIGDVITAGTTDVSRVKYSSCTVILDKIDKVTIRSDPEATRKRLIDSPIVICPSSLGGVSDITVRTLSRSSGIEYPRLEFSIPSSPIQWLNMGALLISGKELQQTLTSFR